VTGFAVNNFSGIMPMVGPRKLEQSHAVVANNADLSASDLRCFSEIEDLSVVGSTTKIQRSGFVFNEDKMFIFPMDIDATYGPIRVDNPYNNRVFFSSGWQAFPSYSTQVLGITDPAGGTHYGPPNNWRKLGVKVPEVPAIVTVAAPLSGTAYMLAGNPTVVSAAVAASPGNWGDDVVTGTRLRFAGFTDADWLRVNNNVFVVERLPEDDERYGQYVILRSLNTADLIDTDAGDVDGNGIFDEPIVYSAWPDPSPYTYSEIVGFTHEFEAAQIEDRIYVYTLVTELGEEGPPSDPSNIVSVGEGQVVTVSLPTGIVESGQYYTAKRIYRTLTGSNGIARYYFVAEIEMADPEYLDEIESVGLGEELQSEEWYPPDEDLTGLTMLPNGVMAGFAGRKLQLSEPYQPHAWPSSNDKTMDSEIVGIAAFGQYLVVATQENPYVGTATDPRSMTFSKLESIEPCISKRTCRSLGYGVMYASSNGLILVASRGTKNVLDEFWDGKSWRALFDSYDESFAEVHNDRYFLTFFNTSTSGSVTYVFDPNSNTLEITTLDYDKVSGMLVDRDEDRLFLLKQAETAPLGPRVMEWNPDSGDEDLTATWRSKVFVMPRPVNMGAMQVFYTPEQWGSTSVEFFCDGVSKGTYTVTDEEPMRLQSGFMAREWQIEITTTQPIQGIYISETIDELVGAMA